MRHLSNKQRNPPRHVDQLRQQTVLAKFGELALRSDDLDQILTEACRLVGEGLGTDLAKVMKLEDGGETLLVRAGVGWKPGIVGVLTLKVAESTSESLALRTGDPTISPNVATETRFRYPQFLIDNGVKAMANVAIIGSEGRRPFGILQIDSREPRLFTDDDTAFLRSYANLIAAAVDRLRGIGEMRAALAEASNSREEADKANHAKSRFLANMSHELRTPLNGILGYAELLRRDGGLNIKQTTRVDAMLNAGEHLLQIISGVLDLSEIEAEHVELRQTEFDPASVAEFCLSVVRPKAVEKCLDLRLIVGPDLPKRVKVDNRRLKQVLLNLLGNAIKFTNHGSVELRLRLTPDGDKLRAEVADTGPGISDEQSHRLFKEFERLDADVAAMAEGAGLGLSISARLASGMGGRLGVEANPLGGSVFWLEIPLGCHTLPVSLPDAAPAIDVPNAVRTPAIALHVLVVDDIAMNRDIAGSFLRIANHQVTYAESGALAVKAVENQDFDVVLMDVRMPEMDGIEAARRIRRLKGKRGQVPIVALTALAFPEQIATCSQTGMNGHVAKPFTPDSLNDAIMRAAKAT